MGAPVVHFEINARNAKRAQQFYSKLFGWKIDARNPIGYRLVDTGVKMGINGGISKAEGGKPFVTIYVQVEEPQKYLDKAVRLGAKVVVPVTVIPNMVTFALFADPDGNLVVVGLVEKGISFCKIIIQGLDKLSYNAYLYTVITGESYGVLSKVWKKNKGFARAGWN